MKLFGYYVTDKPAEEIVPERLAEITLVATASELRRMAAFLNGCAANMDRMGDQYSHEHLSDRDTSFESSPHFVVAPLRT